jgi:hypothetical protein
VSKDDVLISLGVYVRFAKPTQLDRVVTPLAIGRVVDTHEINGEMSVSVDFGRNYLVRCMSRELRRVFEPYLAWGSYIRDNMRYRIRPHV